jgi:hypothetical protein
MPKTMLEDALDQAISTLRAYCKLKGWRISEEETDLIRICWTNGNDIQVELMDEVELEVFSPRKSGDNVVRVYQSGEFNPKATKSINELIYQATNDDWYVCETTRLSGNAWLTQKESE